MTKPNTRQFITCILASPNRPVQTKRVKQLKPMQIYSNKLFFAAIGSVFAILPGCSQQGPKTYPVSGRVIFEDGRHAELGSVEFRSDHGASRTIARGKIERDGSFKMSTFDIEDGAIPGRHEVIVQQMVISEGLGASHQHGPRIPKNYADYTTSGLTVDIKKSEDNFVTLRLNSQSSTE